VNWASEIRNEPDSSSHLSSFDYQHLPVRLTVITATYNRASYLPRCIESVASQSYQDKEHVIIDGGSTDGTIALLKSYAGRYPHVRWLSEKDSGISSALNKGLAIARGDAIGVIGDDDLYAPEVFGIIAQAFDDHDVAVVTGNCDFIGNDELVSQTQKASYTSREDLIQCWRYWGRQVAIAAPSTFIRKRVIDEVGGFDEVDRYAMDYHHWLKITEKFPKIRTVDTVLAKFRLDTGTVSFSSSRQQWEEMLSISKRYWGSRMSSSYYRNLLSYIRYYQCPRLRDQFMSTASSIKKKVMSRS
jgi:glycosyltransferase involved in cell wall biosynthesis